MFTSTVPERPTLNDMVMSGLKGLGIRFSKEVAVGIPLVAVALEIIIIAVVPKPIRFVFNTKVFD